MFYKRELGTNLLDKTKGAGNTKGAEKCTLKQKKNQQRRPLSRNSMARMRRDKERGTSNRQTPQRGTHSLLPALSPRPSAPSAGRHVVRKLFFVFLPLPPSFSFSLLLFLASFSLYSRLFVSLGSLSRSHRRTTRYI